VRNCHKESTVTRDNGLRLVCVCVLVSQSVHLPKVLGDRIAILMVSRVPQARGDLVLWMNYAFRGFPHFPGRLNVVMLHTQACMHSSLNQLTILQYTRPNKHTRTHEHISTFRTCKGPVYSNQYLTSSGGVSSKSFCRSVKSCR
jgi:hypothetical protein